MPKRSLEDEDMLKDNHQKKPKSPTLVNKTLAKVKNAEKKIKDTFLDNRENKTHSELFSKKNHKKNKDKDDDMDNLFKKMDIN